MHQPFKSSFCENRRSCCPPESNWHRRTTQHDRPAHGVHRRRGVPPDRGLEPDTPTVAQGGETLPPVAGRTRSATGLALRRRRGLGLPPEVRARQRDRRIASVGRDVALSPWTLEPTLPGPVAGRVYARLKRGEPLDDICNAECVAPEQVIRLEQNPAAVRGGAGALVETASFGAPHDHRRRAIPRLLRSLGSSTRHDERWRRATTKGTKMTESSGPRQAPGQVGRSQPPTKEPDGRGAFAVPPIARPRKRTASPWATRPPGSSSLNCTRQQSRLCATSMRAAPRCSIWLMPPPSRGCSSRQPRPDRGRARAHLRPVQRLAPRENARRPGSSQRRALGSRRHEGGSSNDGRGAPPNEGA